VGGVRDLLLKIFRTIQTTHLQSHRREADKNP
jgi:hypothetical protein